MNRWARWAALRVLITKRIAELKSEREDALHGGYDINHSQISELENVLEQMAILQDTFT